MSNYSRISAYLEMYPTPWRFIREIYADTPLDPPSASEMDADGYHKVRVTCGETRDIVEDANGNIVFSSWDRDEWSSHIEGDVRALADFVNAVGAAMNVRTERLLPDWASGRAGTLSETDKQRIMESVRRRFAGGTVEKFLRSENGNKGSKETEE